MLKTEILLKSTVCLTYATTSWFEFDKLHILCWLVLSKLNCQHVKFWYFIKAKPELYSIMLCFCYRGPCTDVYPRFHRLYDLSLAGSLSASCIPDGGKHSPAQLTDCYIQVQYTVCSVADCSLKNLLYLNPTFEKRNISIRTILELFLKQMLT